MAQFETVKALDLALVRGCFVRAILLFLFLVRPGLSVCNQGGAFLTFLVFLALFLLLLFPSFLGRLRSLGTWWFCSSNLRFFWPGVFHGATLALGNGKISWSVAPGAVLIHLSSAGASSESRLSLGVDGLLDHQIKAFQLEVSMF